MGSNDSKEDDCVDRSSGRESKDDSADRSSKKRKDQSSRPLKSKIIDPRVIRPDDQASEEEQGRHQLPI